MSNTRYCGYCQGILVYPHKPGYTPSELSELYDLDVCIQCGRVHAQRTDGHQVWKQLHAWAVGELFTREELDRFYE